MPKYTNEILKFRHRGYRNTVSGEIVQVFGNDPAPVDPSIVYALEWDHDVNSVTTVQDHKEQTTNIVP